MNHIQFAVFTRSEMDACTTIVRRADALARKHGMPFDHQDCYMSLAAVHHHTPLRLDALAEADDFNFVHDIFGVLRHIDRTTGALRDCFLPRYAAPRVTR